jgi:hypothetical protein
MSLVRSQLVSLEISLTKSIRSHYGSGVDSAFNRNEYREHFLRGKGGRCVRLITLIPSCAVVLKSGNLNFLEPPGPLQTCNGTALPLPFTYWLRETVQLDLLEMKKISYPCLKSNPVPGVSSLSLLRGLSMLSGN